LLRQNVQSIFFAQNFLQSASLSRSSSDAVSVVPETSLRFATLASTRSPGVARPKTSTAKPNVGRRFRRFRRFFRVVDIVSKDCPLVFCYDVIGITTRLWRHWYNAVRFNVLGVGYPFHVSSC